MSQGDFIDPLILLKALAGRGRKASRSKLQWVQTTVTHFGHEISQGTQTFNPNTWVNSVAPSPTNKSVGGAALSTAATPQKAM